MSPAQAKRELEALERDPLQPAQDKRRQVQHAGEKVHPGWVAHPYLPGCLMSEQWKRVMEVDAQPSSREPRRVTTERSAYELALPLNLTQEN
jgi:hypothetical protein